MESISSREREKRAARAERADAEYDREKMMASPDERHRFRRPTQFGNVNTSAITSGLATMSHSDGGKSNGASAVAESNGGAVSTSMTALANANGNGNANGEIAVPRKHFSYIDDNEMNGNEEKKTVLYELCSEYLKNDVSSIQRSLVTHVEYTLARRRYKFDNR